MFKFKTKLSTIFPKVERIKDDATKEFGQDLAKILTEQLKGIYDDIITLEKVEIVTALPTASSTNKAKFFLLNGTGTGADQLYFCVDTGSLGFKFKSVGLT